MEAFLFTNPPGLAIHCLARVEAAIPEPFEGAPQKGLPFLPSPGRFIFLSHLFQKA